MKKDLRKISQQLLSPSDDAKDNKESDVFLYPQMDEKKGEIKGDYVQLYCKASPDEHCCLICTKLSFKDLFSKRNELHLSEEEARSKDVAFTPDVGYMDQKGHNLHELEMVFKVEVHRNIFKEFKASIRHVRSIDFNAPHVSLYGNVNVPIKCFEIGNEFIHKVISVTIISNSYRTRNIPLKINKAPYALLYNVPEEYTRTLKGVRNFQISPRNAVLTILNKLPSTQHLVKPIELYDLDLEKIILLMCSIEITKENEAELHMLRWYLVSLHDPVIFKALRFDANEINSFLLNFIGDVQDKEVGCVIPLKGVSKIVNEYLDPIETIQTITRCRS